MPVISNFYDAADSNSASYEAHPIDEIEPLPETRLDIGDDFSRWLRWVCGDCRRAGVESRACASIYVFRNHLLDGRNVIPPGKAERRVFFDAVKILRTEFSAAQACSEMDGFWQWLCVAKKWKGPHSIACRTISAVRALRPDYFPDASISKVATEFQVSKACLSWNTTQFLRVFKVQTRVMRGESARENLRASALKAHARD